ncbi:Glycoside hydrolase, family 1, partial [Corchorus capsularis]
KIKGSFDFISLNYYAPAYVEDYPSSLEMEDRDVMADMALKLAYKNNASTSQVLGPLGLTRLLEYFKEVYGNPPIYIYENGEQTLHNSSLEDWSRVKYFSGNIGGVLDAI